MSKTLLMVLLFGFASAASATTEPAVSVTEGSFAAQARAIEKSLADGKTYAEMSRAERDEVRSILGRMSERLEGVAAIEQMPEEDRLALFNDQERVNAMLVKGYTDSRLVCDKRGRTGTHFRETKCQTVAERRRRAEADQTNMRALQRAPVPQSN
jgi:hypothetical protein